MKTLDVKVNERKVTISIPTKLEEITKDWLNNVTKDINPALDYSLIALVLKDNLGMLLNTKHKPNQSVAGVCLFIKSNTKDSEYIYGLECGTPVIIAPSDIAIGNHIVAPKNSITPGKIASIISSDTETRNKFMLDRETIFTVEFKLVPNSSIHGDVIESNDEFEDPFIKVNNTDNIMLN